MHVIFYKTFFYSGLHFWDYGNAFLLEARRAGADVTKKNADGQQDDNSIEFRYDSYVQKIMGYEGMKEFYLCSEIQCPRHLFQIIIHNRIIRHDLYNTQKFKINTLISLYKSAFVSFLV